MISLIGNRLRRSLQRLYKRHAFPSSVSLPLVSRALDFPRKPSRRRRILRWPSEGDMKIIRISISIDALCPHIPHSYFNYCYGGVAPASLHDINLSIKRTHCNVIMRDSVTWHKRNPNCNALNQRVKLDLGQLILNIFSLLLLGLRETKKCGTYLYFDFILRIFSF